ncbi:chloride channel protein CLC-e isoform X1 [Prosopis cineraria]|uniref:chloride channel protein CLC-e isoform X1 n=1 Tax=Prosopis cineraria TaxID=364024 RepID=UPI00240EDDF3|nr:chloride channel protein CLC-e isoform X1 [Prosopis cineraria]
MGGLGCVVGGCPHGRILVSFCIHSERSVKTLSPPSTLPGYTDKIQRGNCCSTKCRISLRPLFALPDNNDCGHTESIHTKDDDVNEGTPAQLELTGWRLVTGNSGIVSSCLVGLLTGVAVVLFNNLVHEIRDLFWGGIPDQGASWLREQPIQATWTRVILIPAFGGMNVAMLNLLLQRLASAGEDPLLGNSAYLKSASQPILKAMAACITLGTGNSLGPEGPSVNIGTSIAKAVGFFFDKSSSRMLSLLAAGSAAGLSSGFNAAVAGCFFAVESVLWPSPIDVSISLTNTTSMVILSAVIASVVSEVGLGSEPAFKVPEYDFRSIGELPLYLLLGIFCGLVSLALSWCTSYMIAFVDNLHNTTGMPRALFPVLGGLSVGLIALVYPEILYWGFENVDILLESQPFVKSVSIDLLLQLIAIKIVATSLCRASGLVGGYYAPSLFIGAATGMAYGKFIGYIAAEFNPKIHLSVLEVASPQAYGLVGMAATLAGVCQVPLTAVLLLFELTQDYQIVLPLLGAVGLSSWISSVETKKGDDRGTVEHKFINSDLIILPEKSPRSSIGSSINCAIAESVPNTSNSCQVESLLCVEDDIVETTHLRRKTLVSQAMKTRYVTASMGIRLTEVLSLMLAEKQSCAVIVGTDHTLIGLLTLRDIRENSKFAKTRSKKPKELLVSELCLLGGGICNVPWTATPDMDLLSAQKAMKKHGVNQVPVVEKLCERAYPVGVLDSDSISLTCSALATKESLA